MSYKNTLTLGEKISIARKKIKLSQTDLAEKLGVGIATISRWETDGSEPTFSQIEKIASVTGSSISFFVKYVVAEPTSSYGVPVQRIPLLSTDQVIKINVSNYSSISGQATDSAYTCIEGDFMFAFKVNRLSMQPEFNIGDIVVVALKSLLKANDYVLVENKLESTCILKQYKVFGTTKILHPLNPQFQDIELSADYRIIGKVTAKEKIY